MAESEKDPKQIVMGWLVPDKVPKGKRIQIPLESLPKDLPGPEPTPAFIESVQRFDVVEPIVVIERPTKKSAPGGYDVIDGRRRVKAARILEHTRINAVVFTKEEVPSRHVLTVVLQQLRSANPIAELEAIEKMLKGGAGMAEITEATGLSKSSVEKILRLQTLVPEIRKAVHSGKIAATVAQKAAGLPEAAQERLVDRMVEMGKLTMHDVKTEKKVRKDKGVAQVPMSVFSAGKIDWKEIVCSRLEETLKLVPDEEIETREGIARLMVRMTPVEGAG